MKRWFVIPLLLTAVALASASGTIVQAQDSAKVLKERKALMKSNGKNAKTLAGAVKKGEIGAKEVAAAAAIAANAKKITGLFPEGTGMDMVKKSRAKPEIWKNWSKFQSDAAALEKAAMEVESAAKTSDAAATGKALKTMAGACKSCHKAFRGPKPK